MVDIFISKLVIDFLFICLTLLAFFYPLLLLELVFFAFLNLATLCNFHLDFAMRHYCIEFIYEHIRLVSILADWCIYIHKYIHMYVCMYMWVDGFRNRLVVTLPRTPACELTLLYYQQQHRQHQHSHTHTHSHLAHICSLYWLHIFILQFDKNSLWATVVVFLCVGVIGATIVALVIGRRWRCGCCVRCRPVVGNIEHLRSVAIKKKQQRIDQPAATRYACICIAVCVFSFGKLLYLMKYIAVNRILRSFM